MVNALARQWRLFALGGIMAILAAEAVIEGLDSAIVSALLVCGMYAAVDGVWKVFAAVRAGRRRQQWRPLLLAGFGGIAAGLLVFAITAIAIDLYVGGAAIAAATAGR